IAMPVMVGVDLGTTSITALAVDAASGAPLARSTKANAAESTAPDDKARGYSEWDVRRLAATASACLREVAEEVEARRSDLAGLGITGQQHGVVLVDAALVPRTPFINWQDRRAEQNDPREGRTYVQRARDLLGAEAPRRA